MQKGPSTMVTILGGLTGAAIALLGILLGWSVAVMTGGEHAETHHEQSAGEH
jgi:hypothetical protein